MKAKIMKISIMKWRNNGVISIIMAYQWQIMKIINNNEMNNVNGNINVA
jgi:hypothetical protein